MRNQAPHRFLPLIKEPDAHASSDSHSKKLKNHREVAGTIPKIHVKFAWRGFVL